MTHLNVGDLGGNICCCCRPRSLVKEGETSQMEPGESLFTILRFYVDYIAQIAGEVHVRTHAHEFKLDILKENQTFGHNRFKPNERPRW